MVEGNSKWQHLPPRNDIAYQASRHSWIAATRVCSRRNGNKPMRVASPLRNVWRFGLRAWGYQGMDMTRGPVPRLVAWA